MLELLKRLEEDNSEIDGLGSLEEDEGDALAARLEGLDIRIALSSPLRSRLMPLADSASANELIQCLTVEERNKFFSALRDPASDVAQNLLASTELDQTLQEPWWDIPDIPSDDQGAPAVRYGHKPSLLQVSKGVVKWDPEAAPLLYNICAVL